MGNRRTHSNGTLLKNIRRMVKNSAASFSVLLGLYYSSSLATTVLLWSTHGLVSVDTCVARPHCMCIASGYHHKFFVNGHK